MRPLPTSKSLWHPWKQDYPLTKFTQSTRLRTFTLDLNFYFNQNGPPLKPYQARAFKAYLSRRGITVIRTFPTPYPILICTARRPLHPSILSDYFFPP